MNSKYNKRANMTLTESMTSPRAINKINEAFTRPTPERIAQQRYMSDENLQTLIDDAAKDYKEECIVAASSISEAQINALQEAGFNIGYTWENEDWIYDGDYLYFLTKTAAADYVREKGDRLNNSRYYNVMLRSLAVLIDWACTKEQWNDLSLENDCPDDWEGKDFIK